MREVARKKKRIEIIKSARDHLVRAHLQTDVISVPGLPSDVHAAFFQLARLTVVPTMFEGGFPFPFCESLSVGTPVVSGVGGGQDFPAQLS